MLVVRRPRTVSCMRELAPFMLTVFKVFVVVWILNCEARATPATK